MEKVLELLNSLPQPWGSIVALVLSVIAAAAAGAAAFPQAQKGSFWYWPRKLLDWCAINIGNAKNKDLT